MCGCGRNEGAGGGGGGFIPGMLTVRQRGLVGPSGGAAGEKVKCPASNHVSRVLSVSFAEAGDKPGGRRGRGAGSGAGEAAGGYVTTAGLGARPLELGAYLKFVASSIADLNWGSSLCRASSAARLGAAVTFAISLPEIKLFIAACCSPVLLATLLEFLEPKTAGTHLSSTRTRGAGKDGGIQLWAVYPGAVRVGSASKPQHHGSKRSHSVFVLAFPRPDLDKREDGYRR